jgi:hypothetical protein
MMSFHATHEGLAVVYMRFSCRPGAIRRIIRWQIQTWMVMLGPYGIPLQHAKDSGPRAVVTGHRASRTMGFGTHD